MDILSIQPATISLRILLPHDGAYSGIALDLASFESDACKAVQRRISDASMHAMKRGQVRPAAAREKDARDLLAAAVVGWRWEKGDNGVPASLGGDESPALTQENKDKLLSVSWIAKQVDEALGDDQRFFAHLAKS